MKKLMSKYSNLTVALFLAVLVGIGGIFPTSALAILELQVGGVIGIGGDPNDEQDLSGGDDGGYDDGEYRDDYWGVAGGLVGIPIISIDGKLLLLLPDWDLSVSSVRILIINDSVAPLGDYDAR